MPRNIDSVYNEIWSDQRPEKRLLRTCVLFQEVHDMLSHRIRKEFSNASSVEIKIKVARRLYLMDTAVQNLLNKAANI
ncbi:MAG: hypothetical protein KDD48_01720 [Bdellovibrionales bacterium]|nr:hypothetical protein [Bdellovibrionales bacterium]